MCLSWTVPGDTRLLAADTSKSILFKTSVRTFKFVDRRSTVDSNQCLVYMNLYAASTLKQIQAIYVRHIRK